MLENQRKKIPFTTLAVEFFSIVLAVLLAFLLNEWRLNQSNNKLADVAMLSILEEIQINSNLMEKNSPHHEEILIFLHEQIQQVQSGSLKQENVKIFKPGVPLNLGSLIGIAWTAANETQAVALFDYSLAKSLFHVYHVQNEFNMLTHAFHNNIFNNLDFYDPERSMGILYLMSTMFQNIVETEKLLGKKYKEAIEQIQSQQGISIEKSQTED